MGRYGRGAPARKRQLFTDLVASLRAEAVWRHRGTRRRSQKEAVVSIELQWHARKPSNTEEPRQQDPQVRWRAEQETR